jgi:plastocyanin
MVKGFIRHRALRCAACLVVAVSTAPLGAAPRPTESCHWLGEEQPLPLPVKTPQDIAFKTAAERQYLIFNLMAAGKVAAQRGDNAVAVEKWETLLKTPDLDPQVERAVAPLLAEARRKLGRPGGAVSAAPPPAEARTGGAGTSVAAPADAPVPSATRKAGATASTVSGVVSGGGAAGPAGAVVWLRRLDGPTPRVQPASGRYITQRDKTFVPHVLVVPQGTTVEFRNDDRIYHNVFSLTKPNNFDAGIRKTGTTYSRTFDTPGPVEILCNIHSTMSAYVVVVDSPYFTKTRSSGAFSLKGVPAGRYELAVWHEAASDVTRKKISVGAAGATGISVSVGGDKRSSPFVPDKYGQKRQAHLGY